MRPAMEKCKTQNHQFVGFFGSMSNYDCSQVEKQIPCMDHGYFSGKVLAKLLCDICMYYANV